MGDLKKNDWEVRMQGQVVLENPILRQIWREIIEVGKQA